MKIYPILNNLGKGKYVFIFILNERAVSDNKGAQTIQTAVEAASAQVNTEPTPAQAEAGNYKKGHVTIGEFDITIENPAGSVRKGVDADGKEWSSTMANAYGYIKGTEGVDGDHIDVFLHQNMDEWNGRKVYVVDQTNADGSFDEHKVMLGFNDKDEAITAYFANYDKTWVDTHPGLRISETNIEDFNKWVQSSLRKTKPFAEYSTVSKSTDDVRLSAGEERDPFRAVYEAAKGLLETAGIPVVEVSGQEAEAMLAGSGDKAWLMGSRTERKMVKVAEHYVGMDLDGNQQVVVDVFSGKRDNVVIEVERPDGKKRVVMRQGQDAKTGTRHSLYRHFDTRSNNITEDEIALIPEIISKGQQKAIGKRIVYDYVSKDGTRLRVTTEISKGREVFTNLMSNRKPLEMESRKPFGDTQSSAQATISEVTGAKVGKISETDKPKHLKTGQPHQNP